MTNSNDKNDMSYPNTSDALGFHLSEDFKANKDNIWNKKMRLD